MGLMDKAKKAIKGRSATVEKGIDRAVSEADKRTKGKYGDKLHSRAEQIKQRARQLDEDRARPGGGTEAAGGTTPAAGTGPTGSAGDTTPAGGTGPTGGTGTGRPDATEPPPTGGGTSPR